MQTRTLLGLAGILAAALVPARAPALTIDSLGSTYARMLPPIDGFSRAEVFFSLSLVPEPAIPMLLALGLAATCLARARLESPS